MLWGRLVQQMLHWSRCRHFSKTNVVGGGPVNIALGAQPEGPWTSVKNQWGTWGAVLE